MKKNLSCYTIWIITWFGLGRLPLAPGTWGSLGAFPLYIVIVYFLGSQAVIGMTGILFLIAWHQTRRYLIAYPHKKDPSEIVIDEVIGQLIALVPAGLNIPLMVLSFILFRILDIWKPWPISWADGLQGSPTLSAFGILLDDVLAGVIVSLCLIGWKYYPSLPLS